MPHHVESGTTMKKFLYKNDFSVSKILSTILIVHLEYGRFRKCNGVGIYVDTLIPQHARHIGDVQPSVPLLGDDLGEADGVGSLHLYNKGEERPISFYASCSDIRCTSYDVVTVGDSAHGGVESRATEARGDDDGCAVAAAYGIEQLLHKNREHLLCCTRRCIVDGEALSGGASG